MSEKDKPAGAGFFGTKELLKKYKKETPGEPVKEVYKNSGLGKWFGQSAGGEAGWDRYNTKGERVGKCGDSKPGEGKPKCLSPKKARQLRTQGGKKAIGNAAKRKKAQDPDTDRPGTGNKPINVSNNIKKEDRDMKSAKEFLNDIIEEIVNEDLLNEENNPTDPAKWAASISAAKSKFDVYPSAYANAWASKHYKAAGGGWESTNEEVDLDEALKVKKNDGPFTVVAIKGGKVVDTFRGAEHGELKDVVAFSKANNKGAKISVEAKGGKIVHTEGFEMDDELIDLDLSEAKKKRITKLHGKYPKGTHYCATHVEHADFGHGNPIHSQHAAPDEFGDIDWYDVMFEHGIEQGVATDDLQIHLGEVHENHEHTEGEELEEAEFDSKKSAEEIRLRTKYRMSKDGGKDGKPYSPEDMHGAMDSLQRKKARTNRVRRLGSGHPSKKNLNLKIGEAAGQNPLKTTYGGIDKTKDTASYKKYLDDVAVAKAKRDAQIKKEREDGTRSRYEEVDKKKKKKNPVPEKDYDYDYAGRGTSKDESVEQVDEMSAKAHYKTYQKKFIVPPIDRARNPNREKEGLEGPYRSKKSGKVFYYDTKAGKYYDADSDIYLKVSDVMEAIKYDVDKGDTGTVSGKGKRDRSGKGEVDVTYSSKERPSYTAAIKPKDMAMHLKSARKGDKITRIKNVRKESVEQVDELNRDTLGSYVDKAKGDIEGIKNVLKAKKLGPVSDKHRADLERELANRTKGRKTAIGKKYTREDAEQVDELTVKTLRSYISKAQKDNTQRVIRMTDKPSHMKADKGEMDKLRKRQKGVANAKTDIAMRRIAGKDYRKRMGEEVEQVDELKMPEKSKRGRATDPVIAAALKRGWKRADLKADGKLRRGDAEGAESHMTNARKRKIASRVEDVGQVDEVSSDTLRRYVYKRRGQVQSDLNTGKHSPKTNRKAKGVVAALSRLDARKNKLEPELKREEVEQVIEAIKFDAGHPDSGISGTVSGKGKRDRKAGGEVRVKYKGHPAYKDDSPGLPIKAREIGRLIKTARKKDTKPHDSKNLTNPAVTRDPNGAGVRGGGVRKVRKEGAYAFATKVTDKFNKALDNKTKGFEKRVDDKFNKPAKTKLGKIGQKLFNSVEYTDEGMSDSAKRAAKILLSRTPKNVHNPGNPKKPSVGDQEARRREDERLSRREGVEDMTAAQKRDRQHRDNPTRANVGKVGLPSTDAERARYVDKFKADKAGKPGNTKLRRERDLRMRLRGPK